MHGLVLSSVRAALRAADLTPALTVSEQTVAAIAAPLAPPSEFASGLERTSDHRADRPSAKSFVDYFRKLDPKQKGFVFTEVKQALAREMPEFIEEQSAESSEMLSTIRSVQNVLQVHSSYIVTQDEQGILIIDQHALHERVMFERLMEQVCKGNLESQRLLMPAVVELSAPQVEALPTMKALLEKIGVEAEPMGPRALAVHAFPTFLFERGVEPQAFLSELLDRAAEKDLPTDSEEALHETLDMMACKAAVKAGDRLSQSELADLLKHRESVERSSNCPHGRPTTLRLSLRDLERQFGRR
jgi:DNA mismatch repair protein MutL